MPKSNRTRSFVASHSKLSYHISHVIVFLYKRKQDYIRVSKSIRRVGVGLKRKHKTKLFF